jgi:hypothetical protein
MRVSNPVSSVNAGLLILWSRVRAPHRVLLWRFYSSATSSVTALRCHGTSCWYDAQVSASTHRRTHPRLSHSHRPLQFLCLGEESKIEAMWCHFMSSDSMSCHIMLRWYQSLTLPLTMSLGDVWVWAIVSLLAYESVCLLLALSSSLISTQDVLRDVTGHRIGWHKMTSHSFDLAFFSQT